MPPKTKISSLNRDEKILAVPLWFSTTRQSTHWATTIVLFW